MQMWRAAMMVALMTILWAFAPAAAQADDKAYARLDNGTLTFYYGSGMQSGDYEVYLDARQPTWHEQHENITKVVIDESFKAFQPTSCAEWFSDMNHLESIEGIANLNTEKVENMSKMFNECRSLTTLDVTGFNTAAVTDMCEMFYGCEKLTTLDVSKFNTAAVTLMSEMFGECSSLTTLDVTGFNTAAVTNMCAMFQSCSSLTTLDVSKFNTAAVNDMSSMFSQCKNLTTLDVSKFNTAAVTSMSCMFEGCEKLTKLNVAEFNTDQVTDMSYMFSQCSSLTTLTLNEYESSSFNTENVEDMSYMFYACSSLSELIFWKLNTEKVENMSNMFFGCGKLTELALYTLSFDNVTDLSCMFQDCKSLTSLDLSRQSAKSATDMKCMFSGCENLKTLILFTMPAATVENMSSMFDRCKSLTTLDLFNLKTEKVENMSCMFQACENLTTIYVSNNFITSSVTDSENMFLDCHSLKGDIAYDADKKEVDYAKTEDGYLTLYTGPYVRLNEGTLTFYYGNGRQEGDYTLEVADEEYAGPQWMIRDDEDEDEDDEDEDEALSVTKVVFDESFSKARPTTTQLWFYQMQELTNVEGLENLNTEEVTSMRGMFMYCSSLTTLDVSKFNTAKVTNMYGMFSDCWKLASLNLSSFNTSAVTDFECMFMSCYSLASLDLSSFDTQAATISHIFMGCSSLKTIYVSDKFTPQADDDYIFTGCNKLKGAIEFEYGKATSAYANYTTGLLTKKVGTNGTDILGATGSPLTIANLKIEDDKIFALNEGETCQAGNASYTRTMTSKWGTLCLPFAINTEAEGNNCYFYNLKEVGDESVTLSKMEGTIEAGTPVVVCKKTDSQEDITIQATDAAVVKSPVSSTETTCLAGTFEGEILQTGGYFIAKNMFFNVKDYAEKGVKVNPYRAYIKTGNNANSAMLTIIDADEPTGIHAIDTPEDTTVAPEYYDATGHRIPTLQRGLNIVKRGSKTLKVLIK